MTPWGIAGAAGLSLALAAGIYFIGDSAGANRVLAREARAQQSAVDAANALADARNEQARSAELVATQAKALIDHLDDHGRDTTREFYHDNPAADRPCLAADRVRAIEGDGAAAAAAAAAGDEPPAVRDQAAAAPRPVQR